MKQQLEDNVRGIMSSAADIMERAQRVTGTAKEMLTVAEFVREGLDHGTIAEAVYQALREVREGASISLALQIAKDEWYK